MRRLRQLTENLDVRQKHLAQLAGYLEASRQAVEELLSAFGRTSVQSSSSRPAGGAVAQPFFRLPLAGGLREDASGAHTAALSKLGIAITQIDVPKTVMLLEK